MDQPLSGRKKARNVRTLSGMDARVAWITYYNPGPANRCLAKTRNLGTANLSRLITGEEEESCRKALMYQSKAEVTLPSGYNAGYAGRGNASISVRVPLASPMARGGRRNTRRKKRGTNECKVIIRKIARGVSSTVLLP